MPICVWLQSKLGIRNLGFTEAHIRSAYFGFYNRKLNVPLIDGGALLLNNLVGKGRAMDMIMTGRKVDAQEAFDLGIVNRLVEGTS